MTTLQLLLAIPAVLALTPCTRRSPLAIPLALIGIAAIFYAAGGRYATTIVTIIGAPSITTIAIVSDAALRRYTNRCLLAENERRSLLWFLAAALLVIYPGFLGFVNTFDFYRLGFLAAAPGVIALTGIAALFRRHYGIAGTMLVVLIAIDARMLTSVNVLDYLLDPYGGLFALGWAAVQITKTVKRKLNTARPGEIPAKPLAPEVA